MKVLINLIGGQPVPNYLAAREISPDRIVNVYSGASKLVMDRLNTVLQINDTKPIEVNAFDFNQIQDALTCYVKESNDEIIVNITGGTKIMSIAAFEVSKLSGLKSIYIDSENHFLFEFYEDKIIKKSLGRKINIKEYFNLHGFMNVKENTSIYSDEDSELFKRFDEMIEANPKIVSEVLELTNAIGQFRRKNKKGWLKGDVSINKRKNSFEWRQGRGIIKYSKQSRSYKFEFRGENFIDYHNGKWFEKVIYDRLVKSNKYDEVARNYEIRNEKDVLLNELDVIGIKNEKLDIFECKSGGLFQDDLNKLKAIKETLGKYSNINLITYFPIRDNNDNERVIRQKLKDYNIRNYTYNRSIRFDDDGINPNL